MSILSSPRALYITRLVQLAFTLGFLILVCYSSVHRGWWENLDGALAIGSTFTLAHKPEKPLPYQKKSDNLPKLQS